MSDERENGPSDGSGNRIEIPGLGECYRLDKVQVGAAVRRADGKGKRVMLIAETPALAMPAVSLLKRDQVDGLIQMLLAARDSLWDLDKKPPKKMAAAAICQCPDCRAKRAAAEAD